jgi:preprotein translocase subunit SecA
MEDALMRIFASDRVSGMMRKLGMKPGEAIEHPWVTKAIANAQRKVESRNFDIRKQLLEYDDVANDQRRAIYTQRNELLDVSDVSETINSIREDVFKATIDAPYSTAVSGRDVGYRRPAGTSEKRLRPRAANQRVAG